MLLLNVAEEALCTSDLFLLNEKCISLQSLLTINESIVFLATSITKLFMKPKKNKQSISKTRRMGEDAFKNNLFLIIYIVGIRYSTPCSSLWLEFKRIRGI